MTVLQLKQFDLPELFTAKGLEKLDDHFVNFLTQKDPVLAEQLKQYRAGAFTAAQSSEWIVACAPILEKFIAELFAIESAVSDLYQATHHHDPIFQFKDHYVHQAKRLLKSVTDISQFEALNQWVLAFVETRLIASQDLELSIAKLGMHFLSDENKYQTEIEKLTHWCALAMQCEAGALITKNWRSFHQPQKKNYENLVPMVPVENDSLGRFQAPIETQRERDGFKLTDQRMGLREVLDEIHYCVYCHKNEGDFCSKGFPVKKNNPELGFKTNPANDLLTGCPLEEKISEMHVVKKNGFGIGALAIVTIDNPFCAVTGHRICNDCMKACIYQKQDPVNIPEIETRVLTDVLNLPWGVEIYDLLIRWNPLRQTQILPKRYNSTNVLVMGMGPAGFTLAHHLLMEGCAVVGCDGLKIEPLPTELLKNPIQKFADICESLDDRIMSGFGGVSEYGITVRWDKNFLKLIYLSLARRNHFQLFGNVRLGGTITVENAWSLGFDHIAIAVGAGLARELPIPNSLAPGMRQANDFLMTLQLSGAIKKNSLANIQVQLPAVVIGGGLTGVDTATEVQAYYIVQVEKIHQRYHVLKLEMGEDELRSNFDANSLKILDEYLSHAETIMAERLCAKNENREPKLNQLIRSFGGVTIAYRKSIQESPAYQRNHEELTKALQEGIYYAEGLEPSAVLLDEYGATAGLTCRTRVQDEFGKWIYSTETQTLPVKSLFVATGAKPNIAYEFEHRGTFERAADAYQGYESVETRFESENSDVSVETRFIASPNSVLRKATNTGHVKDDNFGIFTSYNHDDHKVSFLGDTHPVFHGSVVKAIASAKRGYPKIIDVLKNKMRDGNAADYDSFSQKIKSLLSAEVVSVTRHADHIVELTVKAPLAAKHFRPGQFYRIQNYETTAMMAGDTKLQAETISALAIFNPKNPDQLSFFIYENGASTKLIATFKPEQPIAIMGPTGSKIKIPKTAETILILGNDMSIPYLLSVGPELISAGNKIIFIANAKTPFAEDRLRAITNDIYFCDSYDEIIRVMQTVSLEKIKDITVIGDAQLLKLVQLARSGELKNHLNQDVKFTGSVYGSMQCMLKGVCAQCLQWQVDPITGKRTKAVYACSWQHQPMEFIDIDHLADRLGQNKMQETLTNLWVSYLFEKNAVKTV